MNLLTLIITIVLSLFYSTASAILSTHPTNPRYFVDADGFTVYLAGSHVWYNFHADEEDTEPVSDQEFSNFVEWLSQNNHNLTRLWVGWANKTGPYQCFQRTGPGVAWDGGLKYDLTRIDTDYFVRLRAKIQELGSTGIYCSVQMFGSLISYHQNASWTHTWWHPSNNINSVSFNPDDGNSFFTPTTADREHQRRLVRAFVDYLHDLDNVIFEVGNEGGSTSRSWQSAMVNYIKSYELSTYQVNHPVGITGGYNFGPSMATYATDWYSPDYGVSPWTSTYWKVTLPAASQGKPIILDTDHLYQWGGVSATEAPDVEPWVWGAFTRGYMPLFMEQLEYPYAQAFSDTTNTFVNKIRDRIGQTVYFSTRVDLATLTPTSSTSDCSTSYLLRNPGQYYLAYQPLAGTNFTVNLLAGNYVYEWYNLNNVVNGFASPPFAYQSTGTFTQTANGNRTFTPPFSTADAALFIYTQAAPTMSDFVETFESYPLGNLDDDGGTSTCDNAPLWTCHNPDTPLRTDRIRIVGDKVRHGAKSVVLESYYGELALQGRWRRAVLSSQHPKIGPTWHGWIGTSIYDDSPSTDGSTGGMIGQHITGGTNLGIGHAWGMKTSFLNGFLQYHVTRCYGYAQIPDWSCTNYCETCSRPTALGYQVDNKGKWHDYIFELKHVIYPASDGLIKIYKNGVLLDSQTGPLGYDYLGMEYYFQFHAGYQVGDPEPTDPYRYYYDETRRRETSRGGSYAAVCPTIPPKAPTITYPTDLSSSIPLSFTLNYSDFIKGYADSARSAILDTMGVFTHYDSSFEISSSPAVNADGSFQTLVWSATTSSGDRTEASVSGLIGNTTYFVHARYRDTAGVDRDFDGSAPPGDTDDMYWGPWSAITSFSTIVETGPSGSGSLGNIDNPGADAGSITIVAPDSESGSIVIAPP